MSLPRKAWASVPASGSAPDSRPPSAAAKARATAWAGAPAGRSASSTRQAPLARWFAARRSAASASTVFRLPSAARPGQRHQPHRRIGEQDGKRLQLTIPADQLGHRGRQRDRPPCRGGPVAQMIERQPHQHRVADRALTAFPPGERGRRDAELGGKLPLRHPQAEPPGPQLGSAKVLTAPTSPTPSPRRYQRYTNGASGTHTLPSPASDSLIGQCTDAGGLASPYRRCLDPEAGRARRAMAEPGHPFLSSTLARSGCHDQSGFPGQHRSVGNLQRDRGPMDQHQPGAHGRHQPERRRAVHRHLPGGLPGPHRHAGDLRRARGRMDQHQPGTDGGYQPEHGRAAQRQLRGGFPGQHRRAGDLQRDRGRVDQHQAGDEGGHQPERRRAIQQHVRGGFPGPRWPAGNLQRGRGRMDQHQPGDDAGYQPEHRGAAARANTWWPSRPPAVSWESTTGS